MLRFLPISANQSGAQGCWGMCYRSAHMSNELTVETCQNNGVIAIRTTMPDGLAYTWVFADLEGEGELFERMRAATAGNYDEGEALLAQCRGSRGVTRFSHADFSVPFSNNLEQAGIEGRTARDEEIAVLRRDLPALMEFRVRIALA